MADWLQPLEARRRPVVWREQAREPASWERAVERFIGQYVSSRTGRHYSEKSKVNVRDNLLGGPLTAFRLQHGVANIDQWSGDLAAEYLRWLQQELRRDSATIKKQASQLRSFGVFCEHAFRVKTAGGGELDMLDVSSDDDFPRPQKPPLNQAEAQTLLAAARTERDRLCIAMLLYTGMRPSELVALEAGDVRLDQTPPVVEVRGSVHDHLAKREVEVRAIPLTIGQNVLPRMIRAHLADPSRPPSVTALFASSRPDAVGRHAPLTLAGLRQVLKALGQSTGIKCNAYRLRHTFCTWCADAGVDMLDLQELLGLVSNEMVVPYYRGKPRHAVEAAARVRF